MGSDFEIGGWAIKYRNERVTIRFWGNKNIAYTAIMQGRLSARNARVIPEQPTRRNRCNRYRFSAPHERFR